jgi:hypothetical protein
VDRAARAPRGHETPAGPRTVFQVTVERDRGRKPLVARFGGIPLKRAHTAVLTDQRPVMASNRRNELIDRPDPLSTSTTPLAMARRIIQVYVGLELDTVVSRSI